MKAEFLAFIETNGLVKPGDRVILAVSGGIDSMAMLDLFRISGFRVGVAHVNYRLRGEDSDADEKLVKSYCTDWNIPFFTKSMESADWNKKNIQTQARDMRYQFFEECATREEYTKIATAHHKDDALETFLLNGVRGTGPEGLEGIPVKRGRIIRPMLFTNRQAIMTYVSDRDIPFREDLSNQKNFYSRNKIRNQVLPILEDMHPRKRSGFYKTLDYVREDNLLFDNLVSGITGKYLAILEENRLLNIDLIRKHSIPDSLLYHLLKPYGYRREQTEDMLKTRRIGAAFYAEDWIAVVENTGLYLYNVTLLNQKEHIHIVFDKVNSAVDIHGEKWSIIQDREREPSLIPHFPLIIRPWRKGDVFRPAGMKGKSKDIKKIISESKVPLLYRPFVTVLEDASHTILAVLPFQISADLYPDAGSKPGFDILRNGVSVLFKE